MRDARVIFGVLVVYILSVYGSMAVMSVGSGVVFAAWIFLFARPRVFAGEVAGWTRSPLWRPTLVLSLACVWSLAWARISGLEFFGARPEIRWIEDTRKLWHIFFPFVLSSFLMRLSDEDFRKALWLWLGAGAALACFGILQYYVPIYKSQYLPHVTYDTYVRGSGALDFLRGRYHATGLTGFHLSFASIFGFPTGVWFALAALRWREEGWTQRTRWLAAGAILFFITNILTYSKTTWVALPLLVLGVAFVAMKGRIRYILTAVMIVFAAVGMQTSEFRLRFQGTDTIKERLEVWSANLEMLKQHPLFGVGWHHNSDLSEAYYKARGMHGFVSHAHNNFLDQLASTGAFGLAGFVWWNFIVIAAAYRLFRRGGVVSPSADSETRLLYRALGLGFFGGWFLLHLSGMTQTNFWDAKVLHQIGLVAAFTCEAWRRTSAKRT
ncbi:MAG: O-antigen ligase family protein [Deltaproteobacteria bacterium]|nr:O-antigen ligase family protein [Deltaproteobacteria bacterium]